MKKFILVTLVGIGISAPIFAKENTPDVGESLCGDRQAASEKEAQNGPEGSKESSPAKALAQ